MSNMAIKFRGFRVDNGKIIYGDLLQVNGMLYIYPNEFVDFNDSDFGYSFIEIHPSSLGMFTGRTDKNGKEIYGAIGERGGDVANRGVVSWCDVNLGFFVGSEYDKDPLCYQGLDIEIIGNQWEVDNGK